MEPSTEDARLVRRHREHKPAMRRARGPGGSDQREFHRPSDRLDQYPAAARAILDTPG